MCLLGESMHRLRHAIRKNCFCLFLATVPIRSGDQLLCLGYGERGEETGKTDFNDGRSQT